jgi:hypothetical protein
MHLKICCSFYLESQKSKIKNKKIKKKKKKRIEKENIYS